MESKHTPGPWRVSKTGRSVLAGSVKINQSSGPGGQSVSCQIRFEEMLRANARLIAAAPEMLECLRDIMSSGIVKHDPRIDYDEFQIDRDTQEQARRLLERLK